jgi:hypothetical protein
MKIQLAEMTPPGASRHPPRHSLTLAREREESAAPQPFHDILRQVICLTGLALQLLFLTISESMGNHDSKIVDADSVD